MATKSLEQLYGEIAALRAQLARRAYGNSNIPHYTPEDQAELLAALLNRIGQVLLVLTATNRDAGREWRDEYARLAAQAAQIRGSLASDGPGALAMAIGPIVDAGLRLAEQVLRAGGDVAAGAGAAAKGLGQAAPWLLIGLVVIGIIVAVGVARFGRVRAG